LVGNFKYPTILIRFMNVLYSSGIVPVFWKPAYCLRKMSSLWTSVDKGFLMSIIFSTSLFSLYIPFGNVFSWNVFAYKVWYR
jgi:hypothetical protein